MKVALVIDVGHARGQRVAAAQLHRPRLVLARRSKLVPIAHDGLADRLTVDRPGRAMIMRRAFLRAVINMREDAEAVFGILVEDLALGTIGGKMLCDKVRVRTGFLNQSADLLAPFRSGI